MMNAEIEAYIAKIDDAGGMLENETAMVMNIQDSLTN